MLCCLPLTEEEDVRVLLREVHFEAENRSKIDHKLDFKTHLILGGADGCGADCRVFPPFLIEMHGEKGIFD